MIKSFFKLNEILYKHVCKCKESFEKSIIIKCFYVSVQKNCSYILTYLLIKVSIFSLNIQLKLK